MNHLKTYESFSVGGHSYILVTADKQYYVKTKSPTIIILMKLENLDLKKLNNLKLSRAISDKKEDLAVIALNIQHRLERLPFINMSVKFEDGINYHSEYQEEKMERMPLLRRKAEEANNNPNSNLKYSTKKLSEIINGLTTMRIFVGAYEDPDENDYTNIQINQ